MAHQNRNSTRTAIYEDIDQERDRQAFLWNRSHKWGWGDCASSHVDRPVKLAVLMEEVGEVARALLEGADAKMREELVQVAAVAIAIIEGIDTDTGCHCGSGEHRFMVQPTEES